MKKLATGYWQSRFITPDNPDFHIPRQRSRAHVEDEMPKQTNKQTNEQTNKHYLVLLHSEALARRFRCYSGQNSCLDFHRETSSFSSLKEEFVQSSGKIFDEKCTMSKLADLLTQTDVHGRKPDNDGYSLVCMLVWSADMAQRLNSTAVAIT
jgi:hypothetical protein